MKIAYIVDSSVSTENINDSNVYVAPFQGYNNKGELVPVFDSEVIMNNLGKKPYIEPTPGIYRDMFKRLLNDGYDYVIVVPQSKEVSKSYVFADYVKRQSFENVMVVDVTEYRLEPNVILQDILSEKYLDKALTMTFDYEYLMEQVKALLSKLKLAIA